MERCAFDAMNDGSSDVKISSCCVSVLFDGCDVCDESSMNVMNVGRDVIEWMRALETNTG